MNKFSYLGIKLDNTLNFEVHAKETFHLVSNKIAILAKIRKYINQRQALKIYINPRYCPTLIMAMYYIMNHTRGLWINYRICRIGDLGSVSAPHLELKSESCMFEVQYPILSGEKKLICLILCINVRITSIIKLPDREIQGCLKQ